MVGAWQHNDFYTDTNYKLLDPYTKKHAALESAAATHLQCFAGRFAPVTSTICKRMALRTPSILLRRSSLLDLYTDSIRRQLSTQCTTHHAALEYVVGTHLQCFANQKGAGHSHSCIASQGRNLAMSSCRSHGYSKNSSHMQNSCISTFHKFACSDQKSHRFS